MRIAAIDVGTNTTRLLVADADGTEYRDIDRRLVYTRLGEGVDSEMRINPEAMKRTLAAIAEYCSICGEFGVQRMTIAGTSAVRDAANREKFLVAAEKLAGVPAVALSGDREARLSFWGATSGLEPHLYLVCDVGGGSTELVLGFPGSADLRHVSLNIGSVRLTERFLHTDPPATEEMILLEAAIDQALDGADSVLKGVDEARLVGLGGTATTVAALLMGLDEYRPDLVHGSTLQVAGVSQIYRRLATMSLDERLKVSILPPGRADVIIAGVSILSRTLEHWSFEQVTVSEKDILDGLILELIEGGDTGGRAAR